MPSELNQRFLELATKWAASRCSPEEQRELDALLEAEPTLRDELEQIILVRETLVMIRAMETSEGVAPTDGWLEVKEQLKKNGSASHTVIGWVKKQPPYRKVIGWILLAVLIVGMIGAIWHVSRPPKGKFVGQGDLTRNYIYYSVTYTTTVLNSGGAGYITVYCTFSQDGNKWVKSEQRYVGAGEYQTFSFYCSEVSRWGGEESVEVTH